MPIPITHKDLDAWKLAMDLVEQCYRASSSFPRTEILPELDRRGLQDQCDAVGRLLSGLYRSLEDKIRRHDARRPS